MINEGINDPGIFKAVFLAGGPGSGKSFIAGKTALTALGLKLVNSDDAFERALKNAKMEATPENIYSDRGQRLRNQAKSLTAKKKRGYLDGRLGLVIDGTGKDYDKIKSQTDQLKTLGYDVSMIFVNTNVDSALSRNRMRSRSLPDDKVREMWRGVQQNLGKFQRLFGRDMHIVDNSEGHDYERDVMATYKYLAKWTKLPPKNNVASAWIAAEKTRRGITEMTDSKTKAIQAALNALERRIKSKGGDIGSHAYEIARSYDVGLGARQLAALYKKKHGDDRKEPTSIRKMPDRFKKYTVNEAVEDPKIIAQELRKIGWSVYVSRMKHRTEKDFRVELEKGNKEFEVIGSGNHWELFTGPTLSGKGKVFPSLRAAIQSQSGSINEEGGAGEEGTKKLRKKYQKDVPCEPIKDYMKEAMTSRENKREYDRIQQKLASLARERNVAKKNGQPWKLMDPKEKEYQNLRGRLKRLEEEATTTADIPDPKETAQGPKLKMKFVTDRRRRKDQPPVLLKKYRRNDD